MSVVVRVVPALIVALLLMPAAPASSRIVQCGEVITKDTRVDNDVRCGIPVALEVGAHGVDIDLRGHTVEALEYTDSDGISRDDGIAMLNPGFDDVSVKNGRIVGPESLGRGLGAFGAERLTLRNLYVGGYANLEVAGHGARISDVTVRGWSGTVRSDRAVIDRLDMRGDARSVIGAGVRVNNSHLDGAQVSRSSVIRGSRFDGNIPLFVSGDGNVIADNEISYLRVAAGRGNRIAGNRLDALQLPPGFNSSTVSDNVLAPTFDVFGEGNDGIFVSAGAQGNRLVGNVATGYLDDGFDIEDPTTVLIDNVANTNDDLGIEAVEGVIDGGGNRASGNGNPLQCLNVDCSP